MNILPPMTRPSEPNPHDDAESIVLDIDDPRVPPAVYEHAMKFSTPVRWVEEIGPGEYGLLAADGELLDLVALR